MNTSRSNQGKLLLESHKTLSPEVFSSPDPHDSVIWKEFKSGSEGAFNFIYSQYFTKLYNFGLQFTCDKELVKDLIQDFFIDLRLKRERLGDTNSIKFYLFKSLRRKIARYLKSEKTFSPLEPNQSFQIILSHEVILISKQLTKEKNYLLQVAFSKLTPKQREAIYYIFYENLSYKETASIMGLMNVKSARNLIYKSIDALKKQMIKAN